jgi:hypothetical protein
MSYLPPPLNPLPPGEGKKTCYEVIKYEAYGAILTQAPIFWPKTFPAAAPVCKWVRQYSPGLRKPIPLPALEKLEKEGKADLLILAALSLSASAGQRVTHHSSSDAK